MRTYKMHKLNSHFAEILSFPYTYIEGMPSSILMTTSQFDVNTIYNYTLACYGLLRVDHACL